MNNQEDQMTYEEYLQLVKEAKKSAWKDVIFGALWCIGGLLVTLFTYAAASVGGGTYVVAYGAVIWGAIEFFRGVWNLIKLNNL